MLSLVLQYINNTRPIDVRAIAAPQRDQTPLHWACVGGRLRNVLALLDSGADWNVVDGKGFTAVVHAVHYGRVDVVHVLVRKGGRRVVEVVDYEGHGVLEWAAYYGHVGVAVYLLRVCGVRVDEEYDGGMTALHRAAISEHLAVVDVLLRAGADVRKRNGEGKRAEEVATDPKVKGLLQTWRMGVMNQERPVGKRASVRKYGLVLFYYAVLVASYLKMWGFLRERGGMTVGMGFVFHAAVLISVVSHLRATFGDPGDVQQGDEEGFVRYIERVIEDDTSEGALGPSTFCYICLAPRPPRSKHSRERDRCVRMFDHECPWVNNTVGLYTYKMSLLLAASTAFSEWFFIYVIMRSLVDDAGFLKLGEIFVERPLVCFLLVVHFFISGFCVMLLLTHIRLVLKGQTTFEYLTARKESSVANPYDMGVWKNLTAFLTSTGPGTEHVIPRPSLYNLREVVLSTGQSQAVALSRHIDEEKKHFFEAERDTKNNVGTK